MALVDLLLRQARTRPDVGAIFHGTQHTPPTPNGPPAVRAWPRVCGPKGWCLATVLLFMHNHPRYLEALWGAWWAGLVVVPVNAKRTRARWSGSLPIQVHRGSGHCRRGPFAGRAGPPD